MNRASFDLRGRDGGNRVEARGTFDASGGGSTTGIGADGGDIGLFSVGEARTRFRGTLRSEGGVGGAEDGLPDGLQLAQPAGGLDLRSDRPAMTRCERGAAVALLRRAPRAFSGPLINRAPATDKRIVAPRRAPATGIITEAREVAMGVGWRLAGAAMLLATAVGGQGCVSLGTYEEQNRKIEALTAAYAGADNAVGQKQREIDRLRMENEALKKQLATADQRVANATAVVEAKYRSLQDEYQKMLEQLRTQPGGEAIEINAATNGLVLADEIFFQPGKAELRVDKPAILDSVIQKLKSEKFAHAEIEIAGHTDSDPIKHSGWKDNYQLSAERARSVLNYFVQKGIPAERLHIAGYGPNKPRGDKKAQNRRVEIVLFEKS